MVGCILFRAQPFHNGHLNMIQKAWEDCQMTQSELYVFVGSADKSGTIRNPLPINFRLMLINGSLREAFSMEELKHIHIVPLEDMTDEADNSYHWGRYLFMKMFNHTKDSDMTIYYSDDPRIMLSWFDADDRWCLRFKFLDRYQDISATQVRYAFKNEAFLSVRGFIPNFVWTYTEEISQYLKDAR